MKHALCAVAAIIKYLEVNLYFILILINHLNIIQILNKKVSNKIVTPSFHIYTCFIFLIIVTF